MGTPRFQLETVVSAVRRETPDTVTLTLDLRGAHFSYRPGQFIEIHPRQFPELSELIAELEAAKGAREGPRGFSICSDGSDPSRIEISVKESPGGRYPALLSPWLVRRTACGQRIHIVGPYGKYCLPEDPPTGVTGYLHLCAGSGIAPNFGMIRFALRTRWPHRHLLILQNRTEGDIFYRDDWPAWAERFPDQLKIHHSLSVDRGEHVTANLVRDKMNHFLDPASTQALVCGPNHPREVTDSAGHTHQEPGFCELWCGSIRRHDPGQLTDLGFTRDHILTEMW